MSLNVLFVCGGTAGHVNPAIAVARELRRMHPDAKILFAGAGKQMEKKLIPDAGFHLVNIKMSGLRRDISLSSLRYNINTAKNLTTASVKAGTLLRKFKPDVVVGTGGYICYPILKRASRMGIPTLVHGSDSVPGLTTRMLSGTVDRVLVSYPGMESRYSRPERVVFTGTPVGCGFCGADDGDARRPRGERPLLVSFWGSLGAERMNRAIAELIRLNMENRQFDHIHAAGSPGEVREIMARLGQGGEEGRLPDGIEVREYIYDMASVMHRADLVLCRAGASTLAELTAAGKPAILVPSPYVAENHQEENARQLEKAGGALLLTEKECTGEILYGSVAGLLGDRGKLREMSEAQRALGVPDAAEKIAGLIIELGGGIRKG